MDPNTIVYGIVTAFAIIGGILAYYFYFYHKRGSDELIAETKEHRRVNEQILEEEKKHKNILRKQLKVNKVTIQKLDEQIILKKRELDIIEQEVKMKAQELQLKKELALLEDERDRKRIQLEKEKLEYEREILKNDIENNTSEGLNINENNIIITNNVDKEEIYDRLLNRLVKRWERNKIVWTNPRNEKNYSYKNYYPTIIIKDENYVESICEFTVKDYVEKEELDWWEELASNMDRTFYLFVPLDMIEEIYDALRRRKIKRFINLWVWYRDGKTIKLAKYRKE